MLIQDRSQTMLRIVPAVAILIWRLAAFPAAWIWQDLLGWLAVYWIFTEVVSSPRLREGVAIAISSFLLGVYALGHAPLVLSALGIWP